MAAVQAGHELRQAGGEAAGRASGASALLSLLSLLSLLGRLLM